MMIHSRVTIEVCFPLVQHTTTSYVLIPNSHSGETDRRTGHWMAWRVYVLSVQARFSCTELSSQVSRNRVEGCATYGQSIQSSPIKQGGGRQTNENSPLQLQPGMKPHPGRWLYGIERRFLLHSSPWPTVRCETPKNNIFLFFWLACHHSEAG